MGIFDMRLIAGEIEKERFEEFEKVRKELQSRGGAYSYYFKSKSNTIRLFVDVFLNFQNDFLMLIKKLEDKNAPAGS